MILFQIVAVVFIFFVVSRILIKYKKKEISFRELFFWFLFWILVAVVILLPQTTSILASKLGIGRGADLVIYVAIVFIFYIIFKIYVRLDKTDREITELVRKISIEEKNKNT